jgi:ABC-type branched-subunit amino acid transport system substrate-binding protein
MIVRQALEKAASRDPKKIRDVLATAEFTGLTYPNPTVKFGPDGLNVNNKETLAEWIKSELRTVWPKADQATAPLL